MLPRAIKRWIREPAKRLDSALHSLLSAESDPGLNPLYGDRSIEYAFVIAQLLDVDRRKAVLDVGCSGSPLSTIVKSLGFECVHGIDLLPSPVRFDGVQFFQGDFLRTRALRDSYGVVILCSSIEHFGLAGRFNSPDVPEGDLQALERARQLLEPQGRLILTVPYGVEKVIWPLHRVYNRQSKLLQLAFSSLKVIQEEYYRNDASNVWLRCTEAEASELVPGADNYALGLFAFSKSGSGG